MISAFCFRYSRVLLRSPADTIAMLVRPVLSGLMLMVFAQTVTGFGFLSEYLVVSVMISNVITNTILGAAYEANIDLDDNKRELIQLAPGGLSAYALVQALTQGLIASVQSLFVGACLLPFTPVSLDAGAMFWVALFLLYFAVTVVAAVTVQRSVLRSSYVGVSFGLGIVLTFSGVFYPINALPTWAFVLSSANPVTYIVEGVRAAVDPLVDGDWLGLGYAGVVSLFILVFFVRPFLKLPGSGGGSDSTKG